MLYLSEYQIVINYFVDILLSRTQVSNKKYQRAQMKELLISNHTNNMQHQYENLLGAFNAWKGINEQVDYVCITGIKL